MKQISEELYEALQNSHDMLIALQEAGVDNWEGYDDAMRTFFKQKKEEGIEIL